MNEMRGRLAYVVGENYSELSRLPDVLTATQFFKSVFDGNLPLNLTWMMGQGLNSVEEYLLRLCKTYEPEICFYGDETINAAENTQRSLFSKLSQLMKAMVYRLGFCR